MSLADQVIARLGAALAPSVPGGAGERPDKPATRLWVATVTGGFAGPPSTYTITMDGQNDREGVPSLEPVSVGDTVWVLEQPPALLIVGKNRITLTEGTPFRVGSSQVGSTFSVAQPPIAT